MFSPPRQHNGKVEGPVSIEEDMAFHGMITIAASVKSGVVFHLHGMIIATMIYTFARVGPCCK